MALQIILAATVRKYVPDYDPLVGHSFEVPPGTTVRELVQRLGIPEDEVKLIMVDGAGARWETTLGGNERVALFPPVGGG